MAVTKHTGGGRKQAGGKPQHLSMSEAADLLGVHRSTVYRLAADGRLPFDKVGGQWLTTRAALRRQYPHATDAGDG